MLSQLAFEETDAESGDARGAFSRSVLNGMADNRRSSLSSFIEGRGGFVKVAEYGPTADGSRQF